MTVRHNYLDVAETKPTVAETAQHELVINEADGSLWTKTSLGEVKQVGGSAGGGFGELVPVTGNFTAEANTGYLVSTADITIPVIEAGEVFEFHAITDNVRVLNPSYIITNGTRSIVAGDNLLLKNGQTVKFTALDATTLEVI